VIVTGCGEALGPAKVRYGVLALTLFVPGVGVAVGEPDGVGVAVGVGLGLGLGPGTVKVSAKTTNAGATGMLKGVVPAGNVSVLPLNVPVESVTKPVPGAVELYSSSP
jgi:hypothetical protein